MIVPCGVITTSSPLFQGDQCLGLAPSGYKPHPCRDMNCKKDLYGPQCEHGILSSDPPQVTTGSWEPLKLDSDCQETQLHTPCPITHSQNSQSQRGKAPTVTGAEDPLSVLQAYPINRESRDIPRVSCLWVFYLGNLSSRAFDRLRG